MLTDMAKNIGGDILEYQTLVPIGGDPHLHEPTPRDAQIVSKADLILVNGLTFEGWLNELIENSGTKASIITVTEGIQPIESQQYKNATDPHAWMNLKNGLIYAENMRDAFASMAPEHSSSFNENYTTYRKALIDADAYVEKKIHSIPENKRILITSHDAFQYFGRRYDIQLESILGISTDADVQTSDIARLNKLIRNTHVPAVFIESTINPKLLEQIATDNGIVVGGKLFADSLGDLESPAATYIEMLKHNADVIASALNMDRQLDSNDNSPGKVFTFGLIAFFLLIFAGIIIVRRFL
jgi:ABC-type Zn uptake system ZnuABC Zn-binding protein ZnuA